MYHGKYITTNILLIRLKYSKHFESCLLNFNNLINDNKYPQDQKL
jgi:hypothetical protein